ncbi:MAG: HypC/HybG/HupF family hydrogenase formation chaperone [Actinomycetia bacterium]|nr:HypC/HybG/HupF family hydrogenase formation chaperone [Actinomycetes bacterium]MCP4962151.1 HypC/HybG/HupF family hydrogenase formation chaperone [Actinomycetes bacterium]
MCLAVPGRLVELGDDRGTAVGVIDVEGVRKDVCFALLPEAQIGEYVLVHAGFAIAVVDEEAAGETLALLREIDEIDVADRGAKGAR